MATPAPPTDGIRRNTNTRSRGAHLEPGLLPGSHLPRRDPAGRTDPELIREAFLDDCRWFARHFFIKDRATEPWEVGLYAYQRHHEHPEITDTQLAAARPVVSKLLSRMRSSWQGRIREQVCLWLLTDHGEAFARENHGDEAAYRQPEGACARDLDEHVLRVAPKLWEHIVDVLRPDVVNLKSAWTPEEDYPILQALHQGDVLVAYATLKDILLKRQDHNYRHSHVEPIAGAIEAGNEGTRVLAIADFPTRIDGMRPGIDYWNKVRRGMFGTPESSVQTLPDGAEYGRVSYTRLGGPVTGDGTAAYRGGALEVREAETARADGLQAQLDQRPTGEDLQALQEQVARLQAEVASKDRELATIKTELANAKKRKHGDVTDLTPSSIPGG
jgi:hypothetical protein